VHAWKKQLLEQGAQLSDKTAKIIAEHEESKRELYETVGQLTIERDYLSTL
jgi:transposase